MCVTRREGAVWFFEMTKHERIISMFEIGSRRGRDAKWKEGGTGLKAEMGKEGSNSREVVRPTRASRAREHVQNCMQFHSWMLKCL